MTEKFYFEIPTIEREKEALDYIQEHYEANSNINGTGGLQRFQNDFNAWLDKLEDDRTRIPNEEKVPAETYFLIRESDNKIIGMINIRLTLNERLKKSGGNIGYSIRPSERQKGYNKINLFLGLLKCQEHGISEVMLSCDKSNIASSKTMLAFDARLNKEYYSEEDHEIEQNYLIDVNSAIEKYKEIYEKYTLKAPVNR